MGAKTGKTYVRLEVPLEDPLKREIFLALAEAAGWGNAEETQRGFVFYIPREEWDEDVWLNIFRQMNLPPRYRRGETAEQNWNRLWESSIRPLNLPYNIYIRTSFHPPAPPGMTELIIDPRMSFGTGHHATTALMLEMMAPLNWKNVPFIDMGTGTGILAIYACKRGARPVFGVDNDPWAVDNARTNAALNGCAEIQIYEGDASILRDLPPAGALAANINRNIILRDLPAYARALKPEGILLVSGFYTEDMPAVTEAARDAGFRLVARMEREGWAGMKFVRSTEKA
ncbi:MAG: 50S ribosomal protein L11 methyltransferase [Chlorobi bacterium]|nr:50S ribosomal protein L11 methyltransferase [Chlorobiota bacterium]